MAEDLLDLAVEEKAVTIQRRGRPDQRLTARRFVSLDAWKAFDPVEQCLKIYSARDWKEVR